MIWYERIANKNDNKVYYRIHKMGVSGQYMVGDIITESEYHAIKDKAGTGMITTNSTGSLLGFR